MVLIFSALFGCLKQVEPSKANTTIELPTVAVLDEIQQRQCSELPEELQSSINRTLDERNIWVDLQPIPDSFQQQRNSSQRTDLLTEYPALLIETQAQFFSQLNGRFRWEVKLQLTLVENDEQQLVRTSTIPIFHQFHHEREKEALLAAETIILREINLLMDDYLRGQQL